MKTNYQAKYGANDDELDKDDNNVFSAADYRPSTKKPTAKVAEDTSNPDPRNSQGRVFPLSGQGKR